MRRGDFLASAIGAIVDAEMVPIGNERLVESDMSMKPHAAVTGIDTASSFDPLADFIDTEWMREKDAVGGNAQFVIERAKHCPPHMGLETERVSWRYWSSLHPVFFGLVADWHSRLLEMPVLIGLTRNAFPLRQPVSW